jgi:protein-S-isoprenylcysteine O-methyltransferase Ste14
MHSYAVGLPGLAVLAVGFLAFMLTVLAARLRRGMADDRPQRRSRRSIAGIAVQCLAFFLTAFGMAGAMLDPLSPLALGEAGGIALLMAMSVALFAWASRTMGRNWSIVARTRSDHELVTTGPFAYTRHPIYAAMALLLIALAIGLGNEWRLIVTLPLYALGTWLRIAEEEKLLRDAFGADYDAYAARTKRFVPGLL